MPTYNLTNVKLKPGKTNTDAVNTLRKILNTGHTIVAIYKYMENDLYPNGIEFDNTTYLNQFQATFDCDTEVIETEDEIATRELHENYENAQAWFATLNETQKGFVNTLLRNNLPH